LVDWSAWRGSSGTFAAAWIEGVSGGCGVEERVAVLTAELQ